jgi:hypothetical protein
MSFRQGEIINCELRHSGESRNPVFDDSVLSGCRIKSGMTAFAFADILNDMYRILIKIYLKHI